MTKKHDENECLRSISKVARIDFSNRTIQASKAAIIGIRRWGKIDYLTHYCGWHFYWNNSAGVGGYYNSSSDDNSKKNYREMKKANKTPKLTDKTKKQSKKK